MAIISEDRDRQVVPRLRSSEASSRRGELASLLLGENTSPPQDALAPLIEDWQDLRTVSVASDLVSSAFINGLDDVAVDAAEFVLADQDAPRSARSMAALYLKRDLEMPGEPLPAEIYAEDSRFCDPAEAFVPRLFREQIRLARVRLADYPRNPLLWNDLARLYTTVDSQEKATMASTVAVTLARNNRLVLRGVSRIFLHQGDPHKAHMLLASADVLKFDPWILAAEIATAASMNKSSQFIKIARKMLDSQALNPFHLSELASAVGTLETKAGKVRAGRKLIEFSLKKPSENSIAQASFLSRRMGVSLNADFTGSSEANAWALSKAGQWSDSIKEAIKWQEDQPFSSRPATFGSHMAGMLEQYDRAVQIARLGLLSNGESCVLWNNLAFSLINLGRLQEARVVLQKLQNMNLNTVENVSLLATSGLMHFRSGSPELGRMYYLNAIELAERSKMGALGSVARIYFAMEEINCNSEFAEPARHEALRRSEVLTSYWAPLLVKRLKDR